MITSILLVSLFVIVLPFALLDVYRKFNDNEFLKYTKAGEYPKPIHTLIVYTDTNKYYLNGVLIKTDNILSLIDFLEKWEMVSYKTDNICDHIVSELLLNRLSGEYMSKKCEFNQFYLNVSIY